MSLPIQAGLRAACAELRRKPMPLADLIPLLLEAADELDKFSHLAPDPDPKAHRRCKCEFSGGGVLAKTCAFHERLLKPAVPAEPAREPVAVRGEGSMALASRPPTR